MRLNLPNTTVNIFSVSIIWPVHGWGCNKGRRSIYCKDVTSNVSNIKYPHFAQSCHEFNLRLYLPCCVYSLVAQISNSYPLTWTTGKYTSSVYDTEIQLSPLPIWPHRLYVRCTWNIIKILIIFIINLMIYYLYNYFYIYLFSFRFGHIKITFVFVLSKVILIRRITNRNPV